MLVLTTHFPSFYKMVLYKNFLKKKSNFLFICNSFYNSFFVTVSYLAWIIKILQIQLLVNFSKNDRKYIVLNEKRNLYTHSSNQLLVIGQFTQSCQHLKCKPQIPYHFDIITLFLLAWIQKIINHLEIQMQHFISKFIRSIFKKNELMLSSVSSPCGPYI